MEYILHKKSNCKRIKIRVVKGVVCVSAPLNVSKREIDDFVKEQSAWIKNQLSKYTLSKENDLISLLGKKYRLHTNPETTSCFPTIHFSAIISLTEVM